MSGIAEVQREQLETEVNELIDPIAHLDAFEVLTITHDRERPRQNHRDPEYRPTPLSLEILAAALLARPSREPVRTDKREPLSKPMVESLHLRAERIGLLTQIRQIVETRLSPDPLAELGGEYQSRLLEVRNTRYWSIVREPDLELFAEPEMSDLLVRNLGLDLAQLRGVDDALLDLGANNRVFTSREIVAHTGLPAESVARARHRRSWRWRASLPCPGQGLDPATRAPLMAEFEKTVAEALALWRSETCTDSAAGGAALPPIELGEVQSPSEPVSRSE